MVSGDSIFECASIADSCRQVVAVGVNCAAPRFIHGLISSITKVHLYYQIQELLYVVSCTIKFSSSIQKIVN